MNAVIRKGTGANVLYTGDQITVSVTHEISVGRDKSWVKYEACTRLQPGESTEDARARAIGHATESVMQAVDRTVETVRSA